MVLQRRRAIVAVIISRWCYILDSGKAYTRLLITQPLRINHHVLGIEIPLWTTPMSFPETVLVVVGRGRPISAALALRSL